VVAVGYPLVASLVGPIYRESKLQFAKTPGFADAPQGQPAKLEFTNVVTDAYLRTETSQEVWVIKHSPTEATVFSPICPHMGCRSNWNAESKKFICPCHGSIFSITGKVEGGPSPRALDTLTYKIENGALYVGEFGAAGNFVNGAPADDRGDRPAFLDPSAEPVLGLDG